MIVLGVWVNARSTVVMGINISLECPVTRRSAKVQMTNGAFGVTRGTGELTNYINVYRSRPGMVPANSGNPQKSHMIDLTPFFEEAITLLPVFNREEWLNAFKSYATTHKSFSTFWDDEEEMWSGISSQEIMFLIYRIDIPLVLISKTEFQLSKFYKRPFVTSEIENWDDPIYSLRLEKVEKIITWRTDHINGEKFSIKDLMYASH